MLVLHKCYPSTREKECGAGGNPPDSTIQPMQKALTQMNLQLQHAGTDSTGQTGLRSMPIRVAPPRQPLIDLGPMARANAKPSLTRAPWQPLQSRLGKGMATQTLARPRRTAPGAGASSLHRHKRKKYTSGWA
ncbi:hypothetical protein EFV37_33080 [Mesorhizobium loti]|nr:hypothetical protein EB229_33075 [Mesorhizobium jarvisii]QKD12408.1 hypothetical protein EFV37_33080 [Mesorhizobium loti]